MRFDVPWTRWLVLISVAVAASLAVTLGVLPRSARAQGTADSGLESAGVREALARQLQSPGPAVVSQGGSGGSGDAAPPAGGELVAARTTAFSDSWKTPSKGMVSRVFATPVNYKAPEGGWQPIDNALTPRALGGYENTANSFSLTLPESLSSGVTLTDQGGSVSFSLAGAASAFPSVSGEMATYADVLPATDVSYVSQSIGVQELVTLKSSEAPEELRYTLSTGDGLSPEREADGSIAFVNGQGDVSFRMPAPRAFAAGASPSTGQALPSTLTAVGSGWELTVDTGVAWLREQLASGAVVVDPSIESSQACTLVTEAPTTSYCSSSSVQVGYATGADEHHALLKFPVSSLPLGALILNAKLGLYVQSESSTSAKAVGVYRVTKPWTTAATWDTYDGTHAWSTAGGDYANPETDSDASVNSSVGGSTGWYYWYPTKMVQEWVNTTNAPEKEGYANEGLIVKDQTDNRTVNLLTIASPTASADKPYLEVYYENRGFGLDSQYTQLTAHLTDKLTMSVNPASGDLRLANNDMNVAGTDGMNFTAMREFNSLDGEVHGLSRWTEALQVQGNEWSNGDVFIWYRDSIFLFTKQPNGTYVTPPGIKATVCTAGHSPCPATLPEHTTWRLAFDDPSGTYVDITNEYLEPVDIGNKYGDKLTAGYTEGEGNLTSWTDTGTRKFDYAQGFAGYSYVTELSDVAGALHTSYTYAPEKAEGSGPELTSYTDANGKTTYYEYENYDLIKLTLPGGQVVKYAYNGEGQLTEVIRTTNEAHTEGPTTKLVYYQVGSAPTPCTAKQKGTVIKDPDWTKSGAHETLYCSNVLDEVEKTVNADGNETTASYNPFGDETSSTAASPGNEETGDTSSSVYDEAGVNRLCEVTASTSAVTSCPTRPDKTALVTSYSYLGAGTPYSATNQENPEGRNVSNCYSHEEQASEHGEEPPCTTESGPAGSLARKTDQLTEQNELKFTYETDGNVKTSTDADGHVTEYAYDTQGQLDEIKPPVPLSPLTIKNDADGRPEIITDGAGHKTTITYDKLDRITKIVYSGTGVEKTVTFEYDANGNLKKREDPTGTTEYTVDALGRVTKEKLPGGLTNEYTWDAASNMTSFTDGGGTTKYAYNGLNELESMTEPGATKSTTFAYDNDQRLTKITYPSGTIENYKLEPTTGRPETITAEGVTGTTVPKLTYAYKEGEDATSLMQSLTESTGNTTSYLYDKLNRLTEAKTAGTNPSFYKYTLDGAGNRTKQIVNPTKDEETGGKTTYYVANNANELECRQTVTGACSKNSSTELSAYTYDKAGEELEIVPKSDTSGTTFVYNAASETSSLTPSGSGASALSYGGTGQDDLTAIGSSTLQNSLLGITREVNPTVGTSYFARTPRGLLIDERTPVGNFNPLYDAQGDIIALVSSTGKVERTFRYGPYGENVKSEGTQTIPDPFGYKGGYRMPGGNKGEGNVANGLLHFGQRYYDPTTGRWTQQDPLDQLGSATQGDRFLFAGSNPINESDPSGDIGLRELCVVIALLCGVTNSGETYEDIADQYIDSGVTETYEAFEVVGETIFDDD
jgi:RHS repeat-associated protein